MRSGSCQRLLDRRPEGDFSAGKVTFRWKDDAHGSKKRLMTLTADEFLRRFLLHTLPRRFVRIRSFGFLADYEAV